MAWPFSVETVEPTTAARSCCCVPSTVLEPFMRPRLQQLILGARMDQIVRPCPKMGYRVYMVHTACPKRNGHFGTKRGMSEDLGVAIRSFFPGRSLWMKWPALNDALPRLIQGQRWGPQAIFHPRCVFFHFFPENTWRTLYPTSAPWYADDLWPLVLPWIMNGLALKSYGCQPFQHF